MKSMRLIAKDIIPEGFLFLLVIFIAGCGSSHYSSVNVDSYTELKDIVRERNFIIENNWAYPLRGTQINLIGNPNHIRFFRDSVSVYLPYFGVRHAGGFGRSGAIKYEGPLQELNISEKDDRITLEFEGDDDSESYDFILNLFPNGVVNTSVNSSQRETISYQGNIKQAMKD